MEGLNSPFVNGGSAAGGSSTACSLRLRVLLGALVAGAVITHLVLLGMLMSEQSGHASSAMVYCEVDGDDALTGITPTCSSTSAEGEALCSGSASVPGSGLYCIDNRYEGAVIGSFEWKVSYALALHGPRQPAGNGQGRHSAPAEEMRT